MKKLKVLIACEESQRVCIEFRKLGHEAYSADIQEPSGGHPEWHILGNVLEVLNPKDHLGDFEAPGKYISFKTMDGSYHKVKRWDIIIAHPPCTYLTVSANKHYNIEKYGEKAIKRLADREKAIDFFMKFVSADCDKIAIENPIGVISTRYRKADQIIQPYEYGHPYRKSTCLWLKGLPLLKPTNIVEFECMHSKGKSGGYSGALWNVYDENGKPISYNDSRVAKERSKTFQGIAQAMAQQWSAYLTGQTDKQLSFFEEVTDEKP